MSLKQDASRSYAEPQSAVFLQEVIESCNGCGVALSDSDSESYWESLAAGNRIVARFWSKVNTRGPIQPHVSGLGRCWEWTANVIKGHGQFVAPRENGRQPHIYAHRFAFGLATGIVLPPDIKACHKCDHGICVRPSHLFPGTQADNLADARAKGRLIDGAHLIKVSDEAIADIRRRYIPRVNGKALAAEYGIALTSMLRFVNGTARVNRSINNVERVPTVELPLYELREFLHAPRQSDQSVKA